MTWMCDNSETNEQRKRGYLHDVKFFNLAHKSTILSLFVTLQQVGNEEW